MREGPAATGMEVASRLVGIGGGLEASASSMEMALRHPRGRWVGGARGVAAACEV
jgi:hypothetical protein